MADERGAIRNRISSVCASAPFSFARAAKPFDFDQEPSGKIDQVFRVEIEAGGVIGGMNYSEERTDLVTIWIARAQNNDPESCYQSLVTDVTSMTAAVTRDGLTGGGNYAIPDEGGGVRFAHTPGELFSVAELTMPVNYEASV